MDDFDMPRSGTWEQRGGWVVRRLAKDAALTFEQAAGLVGNLGYESNGFRSLQEISPLVAGSAGGLGYAQWTGPRRRAFEKWAAQNGLGPNTDEANYGFLLHELLGDYKRFAAQLRQTISIEDACRLTHEQYERPQDVLDGSYRSGPDRLKWARRALAGAKLPVAAPSPTVAAVESAVERLKAIQAVLQQAGLYTRADGAPGPLDGDFGKRSRLALNALLKEAGQPGI